MTPLLEAVMLQLIPRLHVLDKLESLAKETMSGLSEWSQCARIQRVGCANTYGRAQHPD